MRDQELVASLNKESAFPVGKDVVAIDPSGRLAASLLVIWVR